MDRDSMALLKFAIAVIIIAVLLIVWFMTIGAPGDDEEEADAAIATMIVSSLPAKVIGLIPVI